MMMMVVVICT